jgi:TatD DNase family protein
MDAHSHRPGLTSCYNLNYQEIGLTKNLPDGQMVSISAHPWNSSSFNLDEFKKTYRYIQNLKKLKIIGIGEIGLDRLRGVAIKEQMHQFDMLVKFAREVKLPIIIHCVRSLSLILKILKENNYTHPCLFHDFYGSREMINQVIERGHYVGVGRSLWKENSNIYSLVPDLDKSHILLETDDMDRTIEDIYVKYASLCQKSILKTRKCMEKNFLNFFELP